MKTVKLNKYQEAALKRFEAAYIALIDSGVSLIAYQPEEELLGLYAYSCEDMEEPISIESYPMSLTLEDEGYVPVIDDLVDVQFGVEAVMIDDGFQPYAKFKEEE